MPFRVGTRDSLLARWQAEWVATQLRGRGCEVVLVPIHTQGDADQREPIGTLGGQGVFTKELQRALLDDEIDLAVHSLKDLPTDEVAGLQIAAVPERGPVADALVCNDAASLDELPEGAVVGTGSLRRRAQLLHYRGTLRVEGIRGNVDTRLRKLDQRQYNAIVLAEAGLTRLGLVHRMTQRLPLDVMLPAVGQGALAIETRTDHDEVLTALGTLDHAETHAAVVAERAMLAALQGGCLAPIAAYGTVQGDCLTLRGRVVHPQGVDAVDASLDSALDAAASLGRRVADALLAQGAEAFIQEGRNAE
jgi:hydroxymethylbilane synthase